MQDLETDVDGREIDVGVTMFMEALMEKTNCYRVQCSWHETGRVQFWSKGTSVGRQVFEVAEEHGYKPDLASRRVVGGASDDLKGYAEFVQK